jgi:YesN/AraC family two-component response regulator
VLIVDDEQDIRLLIKTVIKTAGEDMSVCGEAADGPDALDLVELKRPDVVILDQRMPGLTGVETAQEILRRHPDQRIILCSAYLDPELRQEAEASGILACLGKGDIRRIPDVVREIVGD